MTSISTNSHIIPASMEQMKLNNVSCGWNVSVLQAAIDTIMAAVIKNAMANMALLFHVPDDFQFTGNKPGEWESGYQKFTILVGDVVNRSATFIRYAVAFKNFIAIFINGIGAELAINFLDFTIDSNSVLHGFTPSRARQFQFRRRQIR